jgi:alpha-tubulin suppressor-like RCC1 family protein
LHSLAIKEDGTLWAWGYNEHGQVGNGNKTNVYAPVQIMSEVKMVAAGDFHSLSITGDGTLWAWGNNKYGQLGDGTATDTEATVKIMTVK